MTATAPPFPQCPKCGSTETLEILYGYPTIEAGMAAARGEFVLGGCMVGDESPDYQCRDCDSPLPWVRPPGDPNEDNDPDVFEFCGDRPVRYA